MRLGSDGEHGEPTQEPAAATAPNRRDRFPRKAMVNGSYRDGGDGCLRIRPGRDENGAKDPRFGRKWYRAIDAWRFLTPFAGPIGCI